MNFIQIWASTWINPARAFDELKARPAPAWGLWAVLIRFVGTAWTTTLALYLLGRVPFTPSDLAFLPTEHYYRAEIFFLPIFGLVV